MISKNKKAVRRVSTDGESGPKLSSSFRMTDEEWKALAALRVFKSSEGSRTRGKIDSLLLSFEMAETERRMEPTYEKKLHAMVKKGYKLDKELEEMQVLALERVVKREGKNRIIKHPFKALPDKNFLQNIRRILELFQAELANSISQIPHSPPGPNTAAIRHLVEKLNGIVVEHSEGGPLTRSTKNVRGKGNDVEFVATVLKLAGKRLEMEFSHSMAIQSIRNIRKSTDPSVETVSTFAFSYDLPLNDLELQDPKSLIQSALAIARRLRS